MFKKFSFLCLFLSSLLLNAGQFAIVEGSKANSLEKLASRELKRYIFLITGENVPIVEEKSLPQFSDIFLLGTPQTNQALSRHLKRVGISLSSFPEEGFILKTIRSEGKTLLLVAGKSPGAVLYGVYTLLEDGYDALFTLAGDFLPSEKPLRIPHLSQTYKPVFEVRGTLPWYNFFDSPTAWNLEDYKFYIDQLSKQKLNFLGFHAYDYEPFCAYPWEGKLVGGEPLLNTSQPNWGTHPMKTSEFAFGTNAYFSEEYFGAAPSLSYKTREEGIEKAQSLLREALSYAKARGIKVCLGFEVSGDPTNPLEQERLKARIKHLLKTYPFIDYIWIWEPEGMGINGIEPPSLRSPLGAYYKRWEKHFAYLAEPRRIAEAVRMSLYALLTHRFLNNTAPQVKLIVSGWGGDRWLRFSDFYPGMDEILPKDIIFSALDNINPTDDVASSYGKLSPQRERWPIPWFEFDGDQWFPQPWNLRYEKLMRDALRKGCQGILAIHWRTRGIEETCAFFSSFCWHPNLTFRGFSDRYALRLVGEDRAGELAEILRDLEKLGYRWIGGVGQSECGGFSWSAGEPAKVEKLQELRKKLARLMDELAREGDATGARRLDYYINTADWAILYHKTAEAMLRLNPLLGKIQEAQMKGEGEIARQLAEEALSILPISSFAQALNTYGKNIASRGELGVLATINAKAFWDFREKLRYIEGILGREVALPYLKPEGLNLIFTSLPSTIASGENLSLPLIAIADEPVEISLCYKLLGEKEWKKERVKGEMGNTFKVVLPSVSSGDVLLWYLEANTPQGKYILPERGAYQPFSLSIWHPSPPQPYKELSDRLPPSHPSALKAEQGAYSISIDWEEGKDDSGIDRYLIYREDEKEDVLISVRDNWYEDFSIKPKQTYTYKVYSEDAAGRRSGGFAELVVKARQFPPLRPPRGVQGEAWPGGVKLVWERADADVVAYRVEIGEDGGFKVVEGFEAVPPNYFAQNVVRVKGEPGKILRYRVRAIAPDGNLGEPSQPVTVTPLPLPTAPFFSASFEGNLRAEPGGEGSANLPPFFAEEGIGSCLCLWGDNWVYYPPKQEFDPQFELSLELWMKALSLEGMPVLLGHGVWRESGYFLQILGGQIRFSIAGVDDFDSGYRPPLDQWVYICATYDGTKFSLYVNGQEIAAKKAQGQLRPTNAPLYIGRYEIGDRVYFFNGYLDEVRLYPFALSPSEVKAHYDKEASLLRR